MPQNETESLLTMAALRRRLFCRRPDFGGYDRSVVSAKSEPSLDLST
jgi:hypothetical protein